MFRHGEISTEVDRKPFVFTLVCLIVGLAVTLAAFILGRGSGLALFAGILMAVVTLAYRMGVFITPVIAPAVPEKDVLIRFALMATHTIEQVDEAVEKLTVVFKKLNIL